MRHLCQLILGILLTLHLPWVNAARPMLTDDARIVDRNACQIESWGRSDRTGHEFWALPACQFIENIELTAGVGKGQGPDRQGTGYLLQAKTLFQPLTAETTGVGVVVGYTQPLGNVGGTGDSYVYLPISRLFWGERWAAHLNLGGIRHAEDDQKRLTWGTGHEIQFSETNYLIIEMFGESKGPTSWQGGWRHWLINDRLQLDATVGSVFGQLQSQRWFTLGLRVLFPPF